MTLGVMSMSIKSEDSGLPEGAPIITGLVLCFIGYSMVYTYQFSENLKKELFPKKVPTILKNS